MGEHFHAVVVPAVRDGVWTQRQEHLPPTWPFASGDTSWSKGVASERGVMMGHKEREDGSRRR